MMINKQICEFLKEVARKNEGEHNKGIIYYADLARRFNLPFSDIADRTALFELIGDISIQEVKEKRPMLSVVVVHRDNLRMPGEGFFKLAIDLGVWDGRGDRTLFFAKELRRVHDYWAAGGDK